MYKAIFKQTNITMYKDIYYSTITLKIVISETNKRVIQTDQINQLKMYFISFNVDITLGTSFYISLFQLVII